MFKSGCRALVALSVGVALVGCGAKSQTALPTDQAAIGTCYVRETAEEMLSLSNVSPWIGCDYPHQLEVYAFGTLPEELIGSPDRPSNTLERIPPADVCPWEGIREYLGSQQNDYQFGLSVWAKYPTELEWANGLRTVVCSLAVRDPADPAGRPVFTGSLAGIMSRPQSDAVRLCRLGDTDVACSEPHDAEMTGTVPAPPDPDPRRRHDAAVKACSPVAGWYTGDTVPANFGVRPQIEGDAADCWIGPLSGTVTGTIRGGLA